MVLTDPIADLLTRIRNGAKARHTVVDVPFSRIKKRIAEILKQEGYLSQVEESGVKTQKMLKITLRYRNPKENIIREITRISRPGCRIFATRDDIASWKNPILTTILSTSKGILTGRQAKEAGVGGEVMVRVL